MTIIKNIFLAIALLCGIAIGAGALYMYAVAFKVLYECIVYAININVDKSAYIVMLIMTIYIALVSAVIYKGIEKAINKLNKQ